MVLCFRVSCHYPSTTTSLATASIICRFNLEIPEQGTQLNGSDPLRDLLSIRNSSRIVSLGSGTTTIDCLSDDGLLWPAAVGYHSIQRLVADWQLSDWITFPTYMYTYIFIISKLGFTFIPQLKSLPNYKLNCLHLFLNLTARPRTTCVFVFRMHFWLEDGERWICFALPLQPPPRQLKSDRKSGRCNL